MAVCSGRSRDPWSDDVTPTQLTSLVSKYCRRQRHHHAELDLQQFRPSGHTIPYHTTSSLCYPLSLSLSAAWPAVELGQFKFEFVRIYSVQPSGVRYIHKQSTAFICVLAIYSMYTWTEVSNIRSDKFIRSCQYRVYAARQLFNRDLH